MARTTARELLKQAFEDGSQERTAKTIRFPSDVDQGLSELHEIKGKSFNTLVVTACRLLLAEMEHELKKGKR